MSGSNPHTVKNLRESYVVFPPAVTHQPMTYFGRGYTAFPRECPPAVCGRCCCIGFVTGVLHCNNIE